MCVSASYSLRTIRYTYILQKKIYSDTIQKKLFIHSVAKVYAVLPFYDAKCIYSGRAGMREGGNSHWTYCLYFHSNYSTHSLYHFEKPAIVATKSYIFIFMHVKPIKVTSGFNLRVMKKIRQVALSYRKIKNKYEKADISTIDADPGVPRVSKDAPGST